MATAIRNVCVTINLSRSVTGGQNLSETRPGVYINILKNLVSISSIMQYYLREI